MERIITITGDGPREHYTIEAESIEGEKINTHDRVTDGRAVGYVGGGTDSYRVRGSEVSISGELEEHQISVEQVGGTSPSTSGQQASGGSAPPTTEPAQSASVGGEMDGTLIAAVIVLVAVAVYWGWV